MEPGPIQLCFILTLFIFGNWLHHSSDVQVKYLIPAQVPGVARGIKKMNFERKKIDFLKNKMSKFV